MEPAWKKLVESLNSSGVESPYLDRLRERVAIQRGTGTLEAELISEMAWSLGRAEDKINVALLKLDLLGRECDALEGSPDRTARNARIEAFNEQREVALRAVYELLVQREALGFMHNEELEKLYPVPRRRVAV